MDILPIELGCVLAMAVVALMALFIRGAVWLMMPSPTKKKR